MSESDLNITTDELLQFIQEDDNISLSNMLENIEHMNNQRIITKHNEIFAIWQSTNGRFMTYLPDKTKKNNRRLVSKSTRTNLDNTIIEYYKATSKKATRFNTLYFEWLDLKRLEVSAPTIERIHSAYESFYQAHEINREQIARIDFLYLKKFLLSTIKKYNMNYKQYCNFSCILRGVLTYSLEKGIIENNPYNRFHLGHNVLRQSDTKKSETEVFTIEERELFETTLLNDFKENQSSTIPLAILLDFYTGLRSGELVTLSKDDIQGDYLHIHRTESSYTEIHSDGSKGTVVYEVKESPKSSSGFRDVLIIEKARKILDMVIQFNLEHGWDNNFLFLDDNERITRKRLDTKIRHYCKQLGITTRSMHKIRKYYISVLKLNNVPDEEIKRSAGHRDLTTTYNSYCFSVLTRTELNPLIESAL